MCKKTSICARTPVPRELTSDFSETGPHIGIYEDAYDMWLNGVASSTSKRATNPWDDTHRQVPSGSPEATAEFAGRTYTVWRTANASYVAFVARHNFTSGVVNILDFYDWLTAKGGSRLAPSSTRSTTGSRFVLPNAATTFRFTNFGIRAVYSPSS